MLPTYKPSGSVAMTTWIVTPVLLFGAAVIGVVYQAALHYIPFVLVSILLVFGLAAGVGAITARGLRLGKCRNIGIGALLGAIVGLAGVVSSHISEYVLEVGWNQPGPTMGEFLRLKAETGWSIGKSSSGIPVQGVFVYIVWVIEAACGLIGGVVGGLGAAGTPFCETCDRYATHERKAKVVPAPDEAAVGSLKNAPTIADLLRPVPQSVPSPDRLMYLLRGCPSCDEVSNLSIKVTRVVAKGKKTEEKTEDVLSDVMLTRDECKAAEAMLDRMA